MCTKIALLPALLTLALFSLGCVKEDLPPDLIRQPDEVEPQYPCAEKLCVKQVSTTQHEGLFLPGSEGKHSHTLRVAISTGQHPVEITRIAVRFAMNGRFGSGLFRQDVDIVRAGPPRNARTDHNTDPLEFVWNDAIHDHCIGDDCAIVRIKPSISIPRNSERVYDLWFYLADSPPKYLNVVEWVRTAIQVIEVKVWTKTERDLITCNGSPSGECWIVSSPIEIFPPPR